MLSLMSESQSVKNQAFSLDVYTLSCQNIVVRRWQKALQSTLQSSIKKCTENEDGPRRGYLKKER